MTILPGDCMTSDHNKEGASPIRHPCLNNIESAGSYVVKFVDEWLRSLARSGRFGLSVSFLSSAQSTKLKEILTVVQRSLAEVDENIPEYIEHYRNALRGA